MFIDSVDRYIPSLRRSDTSLSRFYAAQNQISASGYRHLASLEPGDRAHGRVSSLELIVYFVRSLGSNLKPETWNFSYATFR
jgi:hypothetical protein